MNTDTDTHRLTHACIKYINAHIIPVRLKQGFTPQKWSGTHRLLINTCSPTHTHTCRTHRFLLLTEHRHGHRGHEEQTLGLGVKQLQRERGGGREVETEKERGGDWERKRKVNFWTFAWVTLF